LGVPPGHLEARSFRDEHPPLETSVEGHHGVEISDGSRQQRRHLLPGRRLHDVGIGDAVDLRRARWDGAGGTNQGLEQDPATALDQGDLDYPRRDEPGGLEVENGPSARGREQEGVSSRWSQHESVVPG